MELKRIGQFSGIFLALLFSLVLIYPHLALSSPGEVWPWKALEAPPVCSETGGMAAPDEFVATAIDSQGNVIAVSAFGVVVKYSKYGHRLWKKWLNGQTVSFYACDEGEQLLDWSPTDVLVDNQDDIYVLGFKKHSQEDFYVNRLFLMKVDPASGNAVWTREIAEYDGPMLVGIPPSARPKMRLWRPDAGGGAYIVIGSGLEGSSGFFCYGLDGTLVWHKNDGEPTGPFALDGGRLFKAHLVETYPGSGSYSIAPAIDVCPVSPASGDSSTLSCETIETTPPPGEFNPESLGDRGDLICSPHTGQASKVFMLSYVSDSESDYDKGFAFVTLTWNEGHGAYEASESSFFQRGGAGMPNARANFGSGLALTPQGNVWMAGSWWYDPVAMGTFHVYLARLSPLGRILAQYDYGHEKESMTHSRVYEVAADANGNPVIAGLDQDPDSGNNWLFISSNLDSLSIYRYVKPAYQFNIYDPVSPATGNYADKAVDLSYPTAGIPLAAVRTYASRFVQDSGRLGHGWHLGILDMRVEGSPTGLDDKARLVWGDGHAQQFMVSETVEEGDTTTRKFTPIGPQDDNIVLTAHYSPTEGGSFKVYIKKLDRTIIFAHPEEGQKKWYPVTMYKGEDSTAPGAFPLNYAYDGHRIIVTDQASNRSLTFDLNDYGRVVGITGSAGERVSYAYDDVLGHLTQVTLADGTAIEYVYDSAHRLTSITQGENTLLQNEYDDQGRVVRQRDALGKETRFAYDDEERITTVTGPDGLVTRYHFDRHYRITAIEDASGNQKRFAYDDFGRVVSMTLPDGATYTYAYNQDGNLVGKTDPLGRQARYSYDENGNLVRVETPSGAAASYAYGGHGLMNSYSTPEGGLYTFNYSAAQLLTAITDPAGRSQIFAYGEDGLRSSTTRRDGVEVTYERDAAGRVMRKTYNGEHPVTYTFDALGRVTRVENELGAVSYAYNSRGFLQSETGVYGNQISYYYYETGSISALIFGRLGIFTGRNDAGRIMEVEDIWNHRLYYTYDANGRLVRVEGPQGVAVTYAYDENGRITTLGYFGPGGEALRTLQLSYRADGKIAGVDDQGAPTIHKAPPALDFNYTSADRISGEATYDPSGRMLTLNAPGYTYTYDHAGRLREAQRGGISATMAYDGLSRLVAITQGGDTGEVTTRIVYSGKTPIALLDGDGNVINYLIFGPGISLVLDGNGNLQNILMSDWREDFILALDGQGNLVSKRLYSPYGTVMAETAPWPVPFGFLGASGVLTTRNGLVMTRARAYDPELARFLTPDPKRPNLLEPRSLNRYAYAWADPVSLIDPSGLSPFWFFGPRWLIPSIDGILGNVRPTLTPTNTLMGVAGAPALGAAAELTAYATPIYSDMDAESGTGNPQLAPGYTDGGGLVASFYTLAQSAGEEEPPPDAPVAAAPGEGYVAGFTTVPIIALI